MFKHYMKCKKSYILRILTTFIINKIIRSAKMFYLHNRYHYSTFEYFMDYIRLKNALSS